MGRQPLLAGARAPQAEVSQAHFTASGGRRGRWLSLARLLANPAPCCSQVIVIKASGEVFVNQIYTQLPVSAGEGAGPGPQRVLPLTPH